MKQVCIFILSIAYAMATTIVNPIQEIEVNGVAKDMVLNGSTLLIATDNGMVQVYDYTIKSFIKTITLVKIKDFTGDSVPARIFSIDKFKSRYILLSDSGKGGYANLWLHENNVTSQLLSHEDKVAAIKVRFISPKLVLLGLLSNEAVLLNVESKKELFRVQLSESKFSDFALNEDRTQAVFACESGILSVIDTKTGKLLKELKSVNVDNVYKVDFKKDIISGAGQDRRGALYDVPTGTGTHIEGSFLIYATGLSPSAKKVAFAMDEKNDISIYTRFNQSKVALLKGQKSTLNTILFKDENILFSSSDDSTVMMWDLKKIGELK